MAFTGVFFAFRYAFSKDELSRLSRNFSTYTIVAEYNPIARTVTARQTIDYINNSGFDIQTLYINLFAHAFRNGAHHRPVNDQDLIRAFPNGLSFGEFEIHRVRVNRRAKNFTIGKTEADTQNYTNYENALIIPLVAPIKSRARASIELEWTLQLANVLHRTGYSCRVVNLGNWHPRVAVYENGSPVIFPYYSTGDPFFVESANFNVSLTLPAEYVVASSGIVTNTRKRGGQKTHTFSALIIREFALVMSQQFDIISAKSGNTTVNFFHFSNPTSSNMDAGNTRDVTKSLNIGVEALQTFNRLFGAYPYRVLNIVETDFLHGGMEYSSLIMIAAHIGDQEEFDRVIVHEIAHQWWYSLVHNCQIRESWLDEGLSEYATILFYQKNPRHNITREEQLNHLNNVFNLYLRLQVDFFGYANPRVDRHLRDFRSDFEYFQLAYIRAGLIFAFIRDVVGDTNFFNALTHFHLNNQFGIVTKHHLLEAFRIAANLCIAAILTAKLKGAEIHPDLLGSRPERDK